MSSNLRASLRQWGTQNLMPYFRCDLPAAIQKMLPPATFIYRWFNNILESWSSRESIKIEFKWFSARNYHNAFVAPHATRRLEARCFWKYMCGAPRAGKAFKPAARTAPWFSKGMWRRSYDLEDKEMGSNWHPKQPAGAEGPRASHRSSCNSSICDTNQGLTTATGKLREPAAKELDVQLVQALI